MWVKDIRSYDVEIYENETLIYSGNVNDASEEIKQKETESMKIEHKKIIIEV